MVEAQGPKLDAIADFELDDGGDIPSEIEDDQDEEEMFNPQEIDFDEVERLRGKVAVLESVLANSAEKEPSMLF